MSAYKTAAVAALALALLVAPLANAAKSTAPAPAPAAKASSAGDDLDIKYERFVLSNGLTLIVHEDHDAPVVATDVWYHVGSKNEKAGKTGFAHLFEHLMFNGSENHRDEWFKPFEAIGATNQNGTTNSDRTNYFQTVPVGALEMTLWLESDRMGHLLGVIDQAKLDEQRGVVQNEKRQNENQPYGRVWTYVAGETYPAQHPYSWSTIGSMEDLNAASLDDVKEWFRTYYGAANAVLVVAGDVKTAEVKAMVEKAFGNIPSGPPVARPESWIAKMSGEKRATLQDRVPQARVTVYWNTPGYGTATADHLSLLCDVLASGKTSRAYKRLVYDEQICTDVSAGIWSREIGGQFILSATVKAGADPSRVEKELKEELAKVISGGPTVAELDRVKTQNRAQLLRGFEELGGFGGKADTLAESEIYGGSPDAWRNSYRRMMQASAEDLKSAGREWLTDGSFVLHVLPFPEMGVSGTDVDRKAVPVAAKSPDPKFPAMQRATLSNGLDVILVERHDLPLVEMAMTVDAGYAADQHAEPGTASLVAGMLDEGTATRNALQISDELARLGAEFTTNSTLDTTTATMSLLSDKLDPSLDLFADLLLHPAFPQEDFDRQVQQRLAAIDREKVEPQSMALRVLPRLVFGKGHAYSNPLTGSGYSESVKRMTRDSVARFHSTWYRPNNATLLVVGDTTLAALQPKLEKLLSGWSQGEIPQKNIAAVELPASSRVFLVDKPGAVQSLIVAGLAGPAKSDAQDLALETTNRILGGTFSSRINMNLREDKHWSYGSRSSANGARGQRPLVVYAPVQSDKTKESVSEVLKELQGIAGKKPITAAELQQAQDAATLTLSGRWESSAAVLTSMSDLVRFDLPEGYWDRYAAAVRGVSLDAASKAGKQFYHPDRLTWVIVGDRAKIEDGIRSLNLGPLQVIDADGNPVAETAVSQ